MRSIYNQDDLFLALARCLEERDLDALSYIEREVTGWLQPDWSRDAQLALIDAIREAIEAIED